MLTTHRGRRPRRRRARLRRRSTASAPVHAVAVDPPGRGGSSAMPGWTASCSSARWATIRSSSGLVGGTDALGTATLRAEEPQGSRRSRPARDGRSARRRRVQQAVSPSWAEENSRDSSSPRWVTELRTSGPRIVVRFFAAEAAPRTSAPAGFADAATRPACRWEATSRLVLPRAAVELPSRWLGLRAPQATLATCQSQIVGAVREDVARNDRRRGRRRDERIV
jgi:hypothetical protein